MHNMRQFIWELVSNVCDTQQDQIIKQFSSLFSLTYTHIKTLLTFTQINKKWNKEAIPKFDLFLILLEETKVVL